MIFLLHKPAGQGSAANVLSVNDPRVAELFAQVDAPHPFKVGMDSCNVPGAIQFCRNILPESLDTCEGGHFSCYIGADMVMVPCSFDREQRYEYQLVLIVRQPSFMTGIGVSRNSMPSTMRWRSIITAQAAYEKRFP